ncbi:beta-N-acetylhexosaminidase [Pedobacter arcticus]|uniref:beta-N-acetylhexosaminidase n=1 Tax=Pedobacter arcticus TaxID=752140 RepID=UPI00058F6C58|nr:beta-N-acetylhexosaminidase [Pedobacter arcticus]
MKHMLLILFAAILLVGKSAEALADEQPKYAIIPFPAKLIPKEGKFIVSAKTNLVFNDGLANEGTFLKSILQNYFPKVIFQTNAKSKTHTIELLLDPSIEATEGYELYVDSKKITIKGKTSTGIFYGLQTLAQLLPVKSKDANTNLKQVSVPAVEIIDSPRYAYRGMHLDVGRHFFPIDFIKKYIDLIAMHRMNTFHWHLTEDQGWRIEIKKYPRLTEIGSKRKETMLAKNFDPYKGDGIPVEGFYTQEQVKDIVAYATTKHVTIIPEIELPGHSLAALAAYPELGNGTGPYEVGTKWGVFDQIYAPKEETFKFLEDVLTEVIALFPGKYIHIGGDEAPKTEWKKSELAQSIIQKEGLKDEHGLQSYFIQRIEKFLNSKGREIIGWDEILEGGLAPNATVMSWRGIQGGIEAAKQHHTVIMTPGEYCYFDHYQSKDVDKEPLAIGGFTSVEKVYSYEPTPAELSPEQSKFILGAQGNVWTEYMKTSDYVEYMVLPRMSALSEVLWSPKENRNWDDFKNRLQVLTKRFDSAGLKYAKHAVEAE